MTTNGAVDTTKSKAGVIGGDNNETCEKTGAAVVTCKRQTKNSATLAIQKIGFSPQPPPP